MAAEGKTVMRNEDFRKLLATPAAARSGGETAYSSSHSHSTASFTHKQVKKVESKPKKKSKYRPPEKKTKELSDADKIFNESEERLHEIMSKYRDRAAERRKGEIDSTDVELRAKLSSGLRAFREDEDLPAADRREQEIRESKYLGGDIEHTHLVKGLDYSLLNKARSEIKHEAKVEEEEIDIESAFQNPVSKHALLNKVAKTKFSRTICQTLFEALPQTRNEFFQRGRMAYVVELEDNQNEVPVTLLRSTFECVNDKADQNIKVNNMIINKLTEVLSYLRSDGKRKRKEAKDVVAVSSSAKNDSIYDNVGEYKPHRESKSSRSERDRRDGGGDRRRDRNYFDDSRRRDRDDRDRDYERGRDYDDRDRHRDSRRDDRSRDERYRSGGDDRYRDERSRHDRDDRNGRDRRSDVVEKKPPAEHHPFPQSSAALGGAPEEPPKPKKSRLDEDDAYSELYPSQDLFYGGYDSDEDDFSKMDMGPKKGPVKRWDFESQEDFEKYQSGREAMPKAAFQYGVKTNSGRKTRKNAAQAEEKKLDRQLEKIEKIWDDRKKTGQKGPANY